MRSQFFRTSDVSPPQHPWVARPSMPRLHPQQQGTRYTGCSRKRMESIQPAALRIDRAAHLETAWRAQEAREAAAAAQEVASSGLLEVRDLAHLEHLVDRAGTAVVAIAFYSRSCGVCRRMMAHFEGLSQEALYQRPGVRFLKHDIRTSYDELSDVTRLYRVRATPSFAFLVDGAKVMEVRMRDIRDMAGDTPAIHAHLATAEDRLAAALQSVLLRNAPSAKR